MTQSPTASSSQPDIKPRSRDVTDGLEKAAARGMLRAVGMGDDDWVKPQIGVASSWNEITPCNLSLDRLAKAAKDGVHAAGGYPLEFGTIRMSDGSERTVTIIDAFEAVGACAAGRMSREDVDAIERAICPGEGACGGMYTANTMACVAEAIGMSLPGSAAPPATDRRRDGFARKSGEAVVELLRRGITARQIMTKDAFENAIAVVMAFGGSTNAVLHLLAIANEAE